MGIVVYTQLLVERTKAVFVQLETGGYVTESELYRFLHTLQGTAGTVGVLELSIFCVKQLEHLSPEKGDMLQTKTLMNFKNKIMGYLDVVEVLNSQQSITEQTKRFNN